MSQPLIFALGAVGIGVVSCALFGWGRLVRRFSGLPPGSWPVSMALGLATWLFFGGVLNLCHLAYPLALDLLILAGLALAMIEWRGSGAQPIDRAGRNYRLCFFVLVLTLMGFTIVTQLSPHLYATVDDLRKYFAHAVRMVQTGTLCGSPLNALGSETLGGQAFLQGFIVGHFPISLINGADAVFCFGLCLVLAGGVALRRPALGGAAIIGLGAVFLIHPQAINISSLYSTAALLTGLTLLYVDPREHQIELSRSPLAQVPAALFSAGVIALKPTGLLFLALQMFFSVAALAWATRDWRPVLKDALRTVVWTGLFILPWLLLYAPEYLAGITHPVGLPSTPVPYVYESINLLSPVQIFYGGSYLAYSSIALGLCLYAVAGFRSGLRRTDPAQRELALRLAAACAAAVVSYLVVNVAGIYFVEAYGALRYAIPTLIGVAPAAIGLGALCWEEGLRFGGVSRATWFALAFGTVLLALFFQATINRVEFMVKHGTQVAYIPNWSGAIISKSRAFEDALLTGPLSGRIPRLQQKIPPGKSILTWTEAPFQLDYTRNPIIDANESGVGPSWAAMPDADYLLWQYEGEGVTSRQLYLRNIQQFGRRMGFILAKTLDFQQSLDRLASQSELVAHEDGFVIVRLKQKHPAEAK